MTRRLTFTAMVCLMGVLLLPVAYAADNVCDLSQTKCRQNNGKCNIKFNNNTGHGSGSGGGTGLNQSSLAQTIRVRALDPDGERLGNGLSIADGASGSINLDKKAKAEVATIRISSKSDKAVESITMQCKDIIAILEGDGSCKVFNGQEPGQENVVKSYLGYNCADGEVVKPTKN